VCASLKKGQVIIIAKGYDGIAVAMRVAQLANGFCCY